MRNVIRLVGNLAAVGYALSGTPAFAQYAPVQVQEDKVVVWSDEANVNADKMKLKADQRARAVDLRNGNYAGARQAEEASRMDRERLQMDMATEAQDKKRLHRDERRELRQRESSRERLRRYGLLTGRRLPAEVR